MVAGVSYPGPVPLVTVDAGAGAAAGMGTVGGSLVITLAPQQAPATVDNFLAYVRSGFYDGTVFHRNAPGFVMQGGGWAAELNPALPVPASKPAAAPITLEVGRGLSNLRLSVAMARGAALDSATSQFFINLADNPALDTSGGGYAVFGNVSAGAAVVDAMAAAPCASYPALLDAGECLPWPNLVVWTARQTR